MDNQKREVESLNLQRNSLCDKINAETDRLLRKRDESLKELELEHASKLNPIQQDIAEAQWTLNMVLEQTNDLKIAMTKDEVDLNERRIEIVEASNMVETLNDKITGLKRERRELDSSVDGLNGGITARKSEIQEEEVKLTALKAQVDSYESKTEELNTNFELEKASKKEIIDKLEVKIGHLSQKQMELQASENVVRIDLAKRMQELDQRDDLLRAREFKVQDAEAKVQRNAQLLNM